MDANELFKKPTNVGNKCLVLRGGMDQTDREFTIQDFKDRVRNILITTSVCPNNIEDYVHRVGRTGRAGNEATATILITPEEWGSHQS